MLTKVSWEDDVVLSRQKAAKELKTYKDWTLVKARTHKKSQSHVPWKLLK